MLEAWKHGVYGLTQEEPIQPGQTVALTRRALVDWRPQGLFISTPSEFTVCSLTIDGRLQPPFSFPCGPHEFAAERFGPMRPWSTLGVLMFDLCRVDSLIVLQVRNDALVPQEFYAGLAGVPID